MIRKIKREMNRRAAALGLAMSLTFGGAALAEPANNALPTGGEVRIGQADIGIDPDNVNKMNINQASQNVLIDWDTFNVGKENTVQFYQPGADSMAVNRVFDTNPSEIAGHILANGNVTLINPYGVNVYNGAQIDAGSFIASTHDLSVDDYKKLFPDAIDDQGNIVVQKYEYQKYDHSTYENYYKNVQDTIEGYYVDDAHIIGKPSDGSFWDNVAEWIELKIRDINGDSDNWNQAIRLGRNSAGDEVYYVDTNFQNWQIFEKLFVSTETVRDIGRKVEWTGFLNLKLSVVDDIKDGQVHYNGTFARRPFGEPKDVLVTDKNQIANKNYDSHRPATEEEIRNNKYSEKTDVYVRVSDEEINETIGKIIKGETGYRKVPAQSATLTTMATGAGAIYNGGNINAQKLVALVARDITNTGTIEAANVYLGTMGKDFPTAVAPTTPATDSTPTGSGTGWILNDDLSIYHSDNMAKGNGKQKEYGHYLIQHYDYAISVGEKDGKAYYYIDAKKLKGNEKLSDYGFDGGDIVELTKIGDFTTEKKQVHGYLDAAKNGQTPGLSDQYYTLATAPGNNEDPGNNGGAGGTGNGDIPAGDDVTSVRNSGTINANETVAAEAMVIENTGDIAANKVYLGKTVSIGVDYKINVAADAATIANRVYNSGEITANGGTIVMAAKDAANLASYAVADTGVIQAGSLRNVDGTVQLVADATDIQVLGYVSAKDADVKATGGNITVRNMLEPKTESIVAGNNVTISATNTSSENTGKQSRGGNINIEQDGEIVAGNKVDIDGKSGAINIAGDITAKEASAYGKKINVTSASDIDAKSLEIKSNSTSMTVTDDNVADNISNISATALNEALNKADSVTLTVNEDDPKQGGDININAALNRTSETNGTLSVNASHDVNINSAITAKNGKLDVSVNSSGAGYDWQHKQENGKVYVNANVDANGGNVNLTGDEVYVSATISTKGGAFTTTAEKNNIRGSISTGGGVATFNGGINLTGDTDINTEGKLAESYLTTVVVKNGESDADIIGNGHNLTMTLGKGNAKLKDINGVNDITLSGQGIAAQNIVATGNVKSTLECVGIGQSVQGADVSFDGIGNFNSGNADVTAKSGNVSIKAGTYLNVKNVSAGEGAINLNAAGHHAYVNGKLTADGDIAVYAGGVERGEVSIAGDTVKSENGSVNLTSKNFFVTAKDTNITAEKGQVLLSAVTRDSKVKNITAGKDVKFTAGNGSIKTEDITSNGGTVNLDADGAIKVNGNVIAKGTGDTNHHAVNIDSRTSIEAGAVTAENGDVTLSTKNATNTGTTIALGGDLTAKGNIYVQAKGTVSTTGDIISTGEGNITVNGTINATDEEFQVNAGKKGNVDVDDVNARKLNVIGNNIKAENVNADGYAWLSAAKGNVEVNKVTSTDYVTLSANNGTVTVKGVNLDERENAVKANSSVAATGKSVDINGDVDSGNTIQIRSNYGDITTGNLKATNNVVVDSKHRITAAGVNAGGKVDMDAKSVITVTGKTSGNTVDLNSSDSSIFVHDIEATGGNIDIQANYNVYTNSEDNYNTTVKAKGDVSIKAGTILGTGNVEAVEGSVNITSDNKVDTHAVKAGKDITMAGDYGVHAREIVEAGGNVGISSKAGDIKATTVNATGGHAFLNATGNTTVDEVKATDEVILTATNGKVLVNKGVTADDYVLVQGKEVELKGNVWSSEGNINVAATDGNVTAKEITSNLASVSVEATGNVVADVVKAGQATTVKATDININKEAWSNNGALTLDAKGNITAKQITSNNNNVTANAVGTFTADSVIAGKAAEVNAKEITLNSFSKGNSSLKLKADGSVIASDLQSDGFVKLTALDGDVSTGKIVAGNNGNGKYEEAVRIDATKGNIKVDGQITANGDVALYGQYGKDKSIQVLGDNASIESKAGNVTIHQQDGKIELGNTVVKAAKNVDVDSKYGDIAVKSINAGKDVNINVNSETQDSLENLYSNVDIADITAGGAATVKGKEIKLDKADVAGNVDLQAKKTITANDVASTGADVNMMAVTVNAVNTSAKSNVTISGEKVNASNTVAKNGTVAFTGDTVTANGIDAGKNIEVEGSSVTTTNAKAGNMFQVEAGTVTTDNVEAGNGVDIFAIDTATVGTTTAKTIKIQAGNEVVLAGQQKANANANSSAIIAATGENGKFTNNYGAEAIVTPGTWQVYSAAPAGDFFNGLASNNNALWNTKYTGQTNIGLNQYIFQDRPDIAVTANDFTKQYATVSTGAGVSYSSDYLQGLNDDAKGAFNDGNLSGDELKQFVVGEAVLSSDGFPRYAPAGQYDINVAVNEEGNNGYQVVGKVGTVTVDDTDYRNSLENQQQNEKAAVSNAEGRGRIGHGEAALGTGVDRVLGLTEGTLSFSSISKNNNMRAVSYDVNVTPDKVNVSKSEKQGKRAVVGKANQYRSLQQRMTVNGQEADFNLAYNGAVLDVYPTDDVSKAMLQAGDATDNADIVAKALHTSFNKMGVELEDLDGVNVHIDATEAESK